MDFQGPYSHVGAAVFLRMRTRHKTAVTKGGGTGIEEKKPGFRQKTGKTVMDTITGKKIEYACQLLEEGHLKIFEVAYQVGFEDTTYFSHVFKKYTGASAKEFRAQAHRRRSSSGG